MLIDEVDGAENNYGLLPGDEIIDGGTENQDDEWIDCSNDFTSPIKISEGFR